MKRATQSILGMALTVGATYFLDPTSGRRRRAIARDRLLSTLTQLDGGVRVATRDLSHRLRGVAAEARSLFRSDEAPDDTLRERVRARLGRVVSHPGAIDVSAHEGTITLTGHVLAREHEELLRAMRSVPGVHAVNDRLAVHESSASISSLQGGRPRRRQPFDLLQENWSPATRLIMAVAGGALMINGVRSRSLPAIAGAAAGAVVLTRSIMNVPVKRLAGIEGRRAIDIHKSLTVAAPVARVYELLETFEDYPAFTRNVLDVRRHADGRSHWVVAGPAGMPVEWDSVITARRPNEVLAWRTVPNSKVDHAGIIRFRPIDEHTTRLDIQMTYNPPAGALGHVFAKLFHADPKSEMDEDLLRMKVFLETGKLPRDAATRTHPQPQRHATATPTNGGGEPARPSL
ncbi:MAG: SRPBCC family protein [Steroidobacteraceae bacterium]|nr:SRPBCC family protein [Steroidobacteraceae bacterium]